eukprot:COSAG01_NODE_44411_length_419_cov_1.581250_1_plen_89_part_10
MLTAPRPTVMSAAGNCRTTLPGRKRREVEDGRVVIERSRKVKSALDLNALMINIIKWFDDIPQPHLVLDFGIGSVGAKTQFANYGEWAY